MEILIHPALHKPHYYSPYLLGIRNLQGRLPDFTLEGFPRSAAHGLALRVLNADRESRVFISASDGPGINEQFADWCDVYAKVNLTEEGRALLGMKALPIGPSFAIRLTSTPSTVMTAIRSWRQSQGLLTDARAHISAFLSLLRRPPETDYSPGRARDQYIFHASTLWKDERINTLRAHFMMAARSAAGVDFEGGFAPRADRDDFQELVMIRRMSSSAYLRATKSSTVVFNTPAVGGCVGWKLGEYLALGKAILSTPISQILPSPLIHGEHIHVVEENRESISAGLHLLLSSRDYRQHLESNARTYWDSFLSPTRTMERILASAQPTESLRS